MPALRRSTRTRAQPKTNKNTQVVVNNNKPKATKKTRVAKGGVKKKAKAIKKSIIKDKKTLISYIENKIGETSGKSKLSWIMLNHVYSDYTDVGIKSKFKSASNADIERYLNIQHDIINKPGSTLSDKLPSTVDIKMDDTKLINLLILIWLDMTHDETIPIMTSFQDFLESDYVKFLIKTPVKYSENTDTINKMINYNLIKIENGKLYRYSSTKEVVDAKLKNNIHNIWNNGEGMHFFPSSVKIRSKIKRPDLPIYMSLDSEDSNLTELIKSSKIGNYYYIKPLINVANLLDPGRGGSSTSQKGGTMDRLTRQLFKNEPYIHYKFDVNTYKFNFGKYMTIEIHIDGTKFNVSVNGEPLNMGTTTKQAKKNNTPTPKRVIYKISKFMGDFAQILVVAHQYNHGLRSVSGTFDGVFVGITAFIQKELFNLKPRIMFDNSIYGERNGIIVHGFDDLLIKNNKQQSPRVTKYIKDMNANAALNNKSRATTHMINGRPNIGANKSVPKPLNTQNQKPTGSVKQRTPQNKPQGAKRKRTPNVNVNVPVAKKMKKTTPARKAAPSRNNTAGMNRAPARGPAPSRNNTAGMNRPNSNVSQRNRPRSTTGSVGSRVKQIKKSASNRSSAAKTNGSPNSVTQSRSSNGNVESVMRTVSARPATSNSARSNQTRG